MKKVLFIVAVVFAASSMTSCKKTYTCCCDILGSEVCVDSETKLSKKDAKTWCEDSSGGLCNLK